MMIAKVPGTRSKPRETTLAMLRMRAKTPATAAPSVARRSATSSKTLAARRAISSARTSVLSH